MKSKIAPGQLWWSHTFQSYYYTISTDSNEIHVLRIPGEPAGGAEVRVCSSGKAISLNEDIYTQWFEVFLGTLDLIKVLDGMKDKINENR